MSYICLLPEWIQSAIRNDLIAAGIEGEHLENAMDSKLCDIEHVILIDNYEDWVKEDESHGWIYKVHVRRMDDAIVAVSKSEVHEGSYMVCLYDLEYGLIDDVYVDNSNDVMDAVINLYSSLYNNR